jgi:hypothetical protein
MTVRGALMRRRVLVVAAAIVVLSLLCLWWLSLRRAAYYRHALADAVRGAAMDAHWTASAKAMGAFLRDRGFDQNSTAEELAEAAKEHSQFAAMDNRTLAAVASMLWRQWQGSAGFQPCSQALKKPPRLRMRAGEYHL